MILLSDNKTFLGSKESKYITRLGTRFSTAGTTPYYRSRLNYRFDSLIFDDYIHPCLYSLSGFKSVSTSVHRHYQR